MTGTNPTGYTIPTSPIPTSGITANYQPAINPQTNPYTPKPTANPITTNPYAGMPNMINPINPTPNTPNTDTTPSTSTFRVDDTENTIREWEARLHDSSRGQARWMNQATVTSLLHAIRNDQGLMTVAFLSLADTTLTHAQLMDAYQTPEQGARLFKQIFGGIKRIDTQILANIDSDLAALAMQENRNKNGRVFALRAYIAWLSENNDALREYSNMAIYLDQEGASLPQPDPRIPANTDTLTVLMGAIVSMQAQSRLDDAYLEQWKQYLDHLDVTPIPELGGNLPRMKAPTLTMPRVHAPLIGVRI